MGSTKATHQSVIEHTRPVPSVDAVAQIERVRRIVSHARQLIGFAVAVDNEEWAANATGVGKDTQLLLCEPDEQAGV